MYCYFDTIERMFIPEGNAQVQFRFLLLNDLEEMMTTVGVAPSPSFDIDASLVGVISAAFGDNVMERLSSELEYLGCRAVVATADPVSPIVIEQSDGATGGSLAEVAITSNTAALVRKLTAVGGRTNRGRMFIPGLAREAVASNGVLDEFHHDELQQRFNSFFNDCHSEPGFGDFVVHHDDEELDPTPITAFQVQTRAATQRRRLRP